MERKILRASRGAALLCAIALCAAPAAALAEDAEAEGIIKRMDAAMAYDECEMRVSFKDVKVSGTSRELSAEVWYAKSAGTMIAFASPVREKGKKILMIGDSMWMAAPGVSKPVRLSGKEAFMGTSFTNDDIMNFDKADDYESRIVSRDERGWTIELAARRKSLPYQKVRMLVGPDYLPIEQSMFLLSGELSKTIEYSEIRDFGTKRRPAAIKVMDAMSKGASTTVRFDAIVEKRVERSKLSPDRFMK